MKYSTMTHPTQTYAPELEGIEAAADAIKAGKLVAFPTETVYGLGADATNDLAVAKIFDVKGRPHFNPLIVHLPDIESATPIARLDRHAENLAREFWPGALTLILPRIAGSALSLLASAGLPTVAIRIPAHEGARAFLRAAGCPIAAPSANRSGHISPTTAQHVSEAFGDEVATILDGGPCRIGVESTVLDLSSGDQMLLRPGGVPVEELEQALGRTLPTADVTDYRPRGPGMAGPHYRPSIPLHLDATTHRPGEALLGFGPTEAATLNLSETGDLREAAANLFAHLHALDRGKFSAITAMPIPDHGLGRAINDRLRRAAMPHE
jgi:L-threonylcarbamoyladenylate synthase